MPRNATHTGPSWDDLNASSSSRSKTIYVKFTPINGSGASAMLLRISRLGNFRSGSTFWFYGETLQGKTVELRGYCPHRTEQPATFELEK